MSPEVRRRRALHSELLDRAYQRPCNICQRQGFCQHREPEVELAYMAVAPVPTVAEILEDRLRTGK